MGGGVGLVTGEAPPSACDRGMRAANFYRFILMAVKAKIVSVLYQQFLVLG